MASSIFLHHQFIFSTSLGWLFHSSASRSMPIICLWMFSEILPSVISANSTIPFNRVSNCFLALTAPLTLFFWPPEGKLLCWRVTASPLLVLYFLPLPLLLLDEPYFVTHSAIGVTTSMVFTSGAFGVARNLIFIHNVHWHLPS